MIAENVVHRDCKMKEKRYSEIISQEISDVVGNLDQEGGAG